MCDLSFRTVTKKYKIYNFSVIIYLLCSHLVKLLDFWLEGSVYRYLLTRPFYSFSFPSAFLIITMFKVFWEPSRGSRYCLKPKLVRNVLAEEKKQREEKGGEAERGRVRLDRASGETAEHFVLLTHKFNYYNVSYVQQNKVLKFLINFSSFLFSFSSVPSSSSFSASPLFFSSLCFFSLLLLCLLIA